METHHQPDPSKIMQIGMGFFASKTLLTAVNMGLFTFIGDGSKTLQEIKEKFKLHNRSIYDFLDALVALGFLERSGIKESSEYSNQLEAKIFLDKNKPSYIGGILEMANNRLYPFWADLDEALVSGKPQNESKHGDGSIFEVIYRDPKILKEFINGMAGVQLGNFIKLSKTFDFNNYKTVCDIGGSGAHLTMQLATENPHLECISWDLPPVEPIAKKNIEARGLTERVKTQTGDFFKDEFPKADVITMGNILHDWGKEDKSMLIDKAYRALPENGALIVIENIIDDERKENAFGLLMSLNMLIETDDGYDFSAKDFKKLAQEIGFNRFDILKLTGPSSAIIAYK